MTVDWNKLHEKISSVDTKHYLQKEHSGNRLCTFPLRSNCIFSHLGVYFIKCNSYTLWLTNVIDFKAKKGIIGIQLSDIDPKLLFVFHNI